MDISGSNLQKKGFGIDYATIFDFYPDKLQYIKHGVRFNCKVLVQYSYPIFFTKKGLYSMEIKNYVQQQIGGVRCLIDDVLKDLTEEQFNWPPPGSINTISAILNHMLISEDYFIQSVVQGKPPHWEVGQWGSKLGVQTIPEQGESWDNFKNIKISIIPVLVYDQAIRAATDTYLADLTVKELDRRVNCIGDVLPVAEVLMKLVVHSASHAGEIAAVKGMQGIKGLPY